MLKNSIFKKLLLIFLIFQTSAQATIFHNQKTLIAFQRAMAKRNPIRTHKRDIGIFTIPLAAKGVEILVAGAVAAGAIFAIKTASDQKVSDTFSQEKKEEAGPVKYNESTPEDILARLPAGVITSSTIIPSMPSTDKPADKPKQESEEKKEPASTTNIPVVEKPCGHAQQHPLRTLPTEPTLTPHRPAGDKPEEDKPVVEKPRALQVITVLAMAREVSEEQKRDAERLAGLTPQQIKEQKLSKTPETHPGEFKNVKNGPGYQDKDGNIWTLDKLHKGDHWDVSDNKGKFVKEVSRGGRDIDGTKNKGTSKIKSSNTDRSTRVKPDDKLEFVAHVLRQTAKVKSEEPQHATIDLSDADIERASQEMDEAFKEIEEKSEKIAEEMAKHYPQDKQQSWFSFFTSRTTDEQEEAPKVEVDDFAERQQREKDDEDRARYAASRPRSSDGYGYFSSADMDSIAEQLDAADFSNPYSQEIADLYNASMPSHTQAEYNAAWNAFAAANGVDLNLGAE